MADKRINALANTASSTASDDFIAVDGTTNGTRKLNAFSPTFGGNATVTGTLTVGGNLLTSGYGFTSGTLTAFASVAGIYNYYSSGVGVLASCSDNVGTLAQTQISGSTVLLNTAAGNALTVSAAGVVAIPATTASTSTSTGALVVSGGVGIGGSLNAGANNAANSITGGDAGSGTSILQLKDGLGSVKVNFKGNGDVAVQSSTASTSTSSGALVVSGGVGVAGAIYAGGAITTASGQGFDTPNWRFYQSGSSGYVRDLVNGQMALQFVSGNASTIQVYATGTQDSTTTTSGALVSSGGLGVAGAVNAGTFYGLVDGVTAPATAGGYARIYVDSADGDLKVKFGDGTVKTIATDS